MGFLDKLKNMFKPAKKNNLIEINLKDNKCKERIKLLVRKSYDIQRIYENDQNADYRLNKVVICNNCYSKIEVKIDFNKSYKIINKDIKGGKLISEEK
ncbi:hypothetical protein [Natronospora cellulosivora (SeqCode)]